MTASEVVSGWPDEATVERAAEAVYESISAGWSTALPWGLAHDDWRSEARQCARAALSVLPDPTADTVLLGKIREIVAGVDVDDLGSEPASYLCADAFDEIAALLAGGDR